MDLTNLRELEEYFADNFDTMLFPVLSEHYLVAGDLGRAERVCDIGLRHNSDSLAGQFLRARILMAKKEFGEAELCLKKVLGLDPSFLNARVLMAEVQSALQRPKETLHQSYVDILELDPGNRQATKGLASLSGKTKRKPTTKKKAAAPKKTKSKKKAKSPPKPKKKAEAAKKVARKTKKKTQKKSAPSSPAKPSKKPAAPAKRPAKKKPKAAKKSAKKKGPTAQTPATFTLVKVLKNQKLYEEALEVLAVMSKKSGSDKGKIAEEIKSIKALLKSGEGA